MRKEKVMGVTHARACETEFQPENPSRLDNRAGGLGKHRNLCYTIMYLYVQVDTSLCPFHTVSHDPAIKLKG